MSTILVADDDRDIVKIICVYLKSEGYETMVAYNGREALESVEKGMPDLVLLDVMMPVMNGIEAITEIRKKSNIPVIFLTAKAEDTDKIMGLNIGADDYITKPFNPSELIARVNSALRRYHVLGGEDGIREKEPENLMFGGLCLNDRKKEFTVDGQVVSLTPTEFEIMKLLMQNPERSYLPRT